MERMFVEQYGMFCRKGDRRRFVVSNVPEWL